MDPFTRKRFETLLCSARDTLMESLQSLEDSEDEHGRQGEPMDEADVAVMEHQRETLRRLRNRYRQLYWEIENALKRLKDGDFGVCDRCGDPIQPQRLEVQPTARLCIDCQRALEKQGGTFRRPVSADLPLDSRAAETLSVPQWRYPECVNS
ncbi:TraR/DksA family transcriptional regulator [Desulfosoma sp.]|uniref:TraR/DksA family transcriptional regulator n=1 Tax=Desulfacinum infernum TaxID=35837 RepID=A0A832A2E7_9BACT